MAEVQDRMGKKVKKIYEISRHLIQDVKNTGTLDGIKCLRKCDVFQEKRSMLLSFQSK